MSTRARYTSMRFRHPPLFLGCVAISCLAPLPTSYGQPEINLQRCNGSGDLEKECLSVPSHDERVQAVRSFAT